MAWGDYVQHVGAVGLGGTTAQRTLTLTLAAADTEPGNSLVLVSAVSNMRTVIDVTDTRGNTWTKAVEEGNENGAAILFTNMDRGALGVGDRITVTYSSTGWCAFGVHECEGLLAPDRSATTIANNSAAADTGTTDTTSTAVQVCIGAWAISGIRRLTLTAPAGALELPRVGSDTGAFVRSAYAAAYRTSAVGTQQITGTFASTSNWPGVIATFKNAAEAAPIDAGSREFDGVDDVLQFGAASPNPTGALSLVAVVRPAVNRRDMALVSGAGFRPEFGLGQSNTLYYYDGATGRNGTAATFPATDRWSVVAFTKAAGTVRGRMHMVPLGGSGAVHENANGTNADVTPVAPWSVGADTLPATEYQFQGRVAAWAVWDRALADAEVEQCATWSGMQQLAPARAARLDGEPPFFGQVDGNGSRHSPDDPPNFWRNPLPATEGAFRRFDGVNDSIHLGYGNGAWDHGAGAQTWMALQRVTEPWRSFWTPYAADGSTVGGILQEADSAGGVTLYSAPTWEGTDSWPGVLTVAAPGAWRLWGFSMPAGGGNVRFHAFDFETRTWQHADRWRLPAPGRVGRGGTLRVGEFDTRWYRGDFAALGTWGRVLTDADVEATAAGTVQDWLGIGGGPAGLWAFDRSSSAPIRDLTGNNADAVAINGAAVVAETVPFSYRQAITAPVRDFDGIDDMIQTAPGDTDQLGAWSIAMVVRPRTGGFFGLAGAHTAQRFPRGYMLMCEDSRLYVFATASSTGGVSGIYSSAGFIPPGEWRLVAVTKPHGSRPVRFHSFDFATQTWRRETSAGSLRGPDPNFVAAIDSYRFGNFQDSNRLNGQIAAAALWPFELADVQVDELAQVPTLDEWPTLNGPVATWLFNLLDGETLVDLVGGAHEVSRTGTSTRFVAPPVALGAPLGTDLRRSAAGITTATRTAVSAGKRNVLPVELVLSTGGALAATGTRFASAEAAMSGGGAADGSGIKRAGTGAASAGGGSALAGGAKAASSFAAASGGGHARGTAGRSAQRVAGVSSAGAAVAVGGKSVVVLSSIAGAGSGRGAGWKSSGGIAVVTGRGGASTSGVKSSALTAALSGAGALVVRAYRLVGGKALTAAGGALDATGGKHARTAERLTATGTHRAAGFKLSASAAQVRGDGALEARGLLVWAGYAFATGGGQLVVDGGKSTTAVAHVLGAGGGSADDGAKSVGTVAVATGHGVLVVLGTARRPPTAPPMPGRVSAGRFPNEDAAATFDEPGSSSARFT